ncbi:hypothetical protein [Methylomonas sp. AM2-LC]|uniref:hypothetical protein n=1 Tax=Methylomonas sp. AM2-LC TaxID=3153301 RepID=UPI003263CF8D
MKIKIPNSLPYEFDSFRVWRGVLKGLITFQFVIIIPGIIYFIVINDMAGMLCLVVTGVFLLLGTVPVAKHSEGANGTINKNGVLIWPNKIFRKAGKETGRLISLNDFSAISVVLRPPAHDSNLETARVMLTAKQRIDDIILDTGTIDEGKKLGMALHELLGLPYQELNGVNKLSEFIARR